VSQWLRDAVAAVVGGAELTAHERATLLDLAVHTPHTSGARVNALLLCYLVGRLQGERSLDEVAGAIRRSTS
jgi:hypothetical protein